MAQNRRPPAYQEYAAELLADVRFRMLEPAARGLLYTMKLECWVNGGLPANPSVLAKILGLGLELEEVQALLSAVMPFFENRDGFLVCPELEDYKSHLKDIRDRKSQGGKNSAESKKAKGQDTCKIAASNLQVLSKAKSSSVQQSQNQSVEKGVDPDPWVSDYEKASNGQ